MKNLIYIAIFTLACNLQGFSKSDIDYPLRFDRYYSYEEVNDALELLHSKNKKLTSLEVIGQSEEGRKIMALTINNPKTGIDSEKPGIYVDGNIHGNEIQAGEVCLYFANMLLNKYESNQKIKELVDRTAFYIIPVVNVDGRWHFFNDANTSSSNRGLRRPKDDDRDGLFDEDGYDDLDGDGNICQMRIKDEFGSYKTDPEDDRLMIRRKATEKGEWTILGHEGIDNDNDGRFNEDTEGYVDPNRNWPFDWKPSYIQQGAGDYPWSGVGLKAVGEFIAKRMNIIMVWAFHNSGGMFLRGPSSKDLVVPGSDIKVYDLLGNNAEKIVPGYVYKPSYKLYPTYGDFGEFTYNCIGAFTFVGELYQRQVETFNKEAKPADGQERNRERLKFNDYLGQGELYKPWKPYKHPLYGDIEIGGWVKMSSRLPHPFMLQELVHRNASAVLFSAQQTPQIKMEVYHKEKIGKNLYKVRVRLINTKGISTMSQHSWNRKLYTPDMLKVYGKKATVISSGKVIDNFKDQIKYKTHKPELQFTKVAGYEKVEYEFIIEGKGKISIDYSSLKTMNVSTEVEL